MRTDGSVECWGNDRIGQATPPGGSFASISAGPLHTCGVKTDGSVECWGYDRDDQTTPPGGLFASIRMGVTQSQRTHV